MRRVLGLAARGVNAAIKRIRHRWMRMRAFRGGLVAFARGTRQVLWYAPPGEQRTCPACASGELELMLPLPYAPPIAYGWHFGFVTGCRRCGLLFANPLPDQARLDALYSPGGDWGRARQDESEPPVNRTRVEQLFAPIRLDLDVMHPPPGAAVLDFGCGAGGMLDALQELGWETHGVEPATRVAFARHREVTTIPADPCFNLAVVHHVLEHVRDPLDILRRLAGALRPGGFILISVPDLDEVADRGDIEYVLRSKTHVLAYSSDCLRWLTASAGLRTISAARPAASRRRIVLARREEHGERPPSPLEAARNALRRYFERHPDETLPFRGAPARFRAALCNLQRSSRHALQSR